MGITIRRSASLVMKAAISLVVSSSVPVSSRGL
jgi:hypothetical protein